MISFSARYIPARLIMVTDQLSHHNQMIPIEWSFLPRLFNRICKSYGRPMIDLFKTKKKKKNWKLPIYVTLVLHPIVWKEDAFQHSRDHLEVYAFFPFAITRKVPDKSISEGLTMVQVVILLPHKEWFPDLLSLLVEQPLHLCFGTSRFICMF